MKRRYAVLVGVIAFLGLLIFSIPTVSSTALSAEPKPASQQTLGIEDEIQQAVLNAVEGDQKYINSGLDNSIQVTDVQLSQDQQWATAWVVYYDPTIDAIIPTEPGLAVVHYTDDQWQVVLPDDPAWQAAVMMVPDDLLSQDEKEMWLAMNQGSVETIQTQTGYFLPWHGGDTAYLSRSVGHDADFSTAHYAFDFFLLGSTVCPSGASEVNSGITGLNFGIYASKAATVWGWDDSVTDCDHSKVNFIVLRNVDDPTIFQLYMHLSKGSIPSALKTVGAPVARGQFIALADNTGASTGSHLHFQVERQPTWPTVNPYWNTALDVSFADVPINGGRPRVYQLDNAYCRSDDICTTFQQTYVSGNYFQGDATPPTGSLSGVTEGQVVQAPSISLSGWGSDDNSGLEYGQLIANFNGAWQNLGSHFNPNFTYTWDLCDPSRPVTNGPISVALLLYDRAGNAAPRVGLTNFVMNYSCPKPPPSCLPDANQVTLFEDANYQGGCVKFSPGNYPTGQTLDPLGNNDGASILVGSNVVATLFSEENYAGHSQSFLTDTGYLQSYWVPANTLSSMMVMTRDVLPATPITVSPIASSIFRAGDVVPFFLRDGGGGTEYRFELYLNSNWYKTYDWQSDPVLYVDSLGEGNYNWRVQSRNTAGESQWSQKVSFSIQSPIVFPPAVTAPYSDTMENTQSQWVSDGFWNYKNNAGMAHSGTYSWWYQNPYGDYDNEQPNGGSLTSKPISIPGVGYYLRFYYRYQTETSGLNWDQRWVQISVNDGPFKNVMQLYDDPQIPETLSWMRNKAIDLSPYVGKIIRIRFQFATLDASDNNYPGWGIDDVSVSAVPPSTCGDTRLDETPEDAFLLTYDPSMIIPGEICPNGDYDYYKFNGNTGDKIVVDVDAMVYGSALDSYLYLLDTDGETILAENDDEIYSQLRDPLLSYTLPKAGTYYLKLKAWKHPLVGGSNYSYKLRLYEDHISPAAQLTWPSSYTYLPDADMTVAANVDEIPQGVNRVEFYWHPANWQSGNWQLLGTDRDGSDGWSLVFNPASQPEGNNSALFIQAYDQAGNWTGVGAWGLGIDKTAPTTAMTSLAGTQPSNAFLLTWTGSDNLSGLNYVQIQQKIGGGNWTTFPNIDGSVFQNWVIGTPGSTFSYRTRGIDYSGNTENYPVDAETSTTIPAASVLCYSPDIYDTSGNDNTAARASQIFIDGASQDHNFCNSLVPDFQNDEDWTSMTVTKGDQLLISSIARSQQTAVAIDLYAEDGTTLIREVSQPIFGRNTNLLWISDRDGMVYIRLRHVDGRVIGSEVHSTLSVSTGSWTFLPLIFH